MGMQMVLHLPDSECFKYNVELNRFDYFLNTLCKLTLHHLFNRSLLASVAPVLSCFNWLWLQLLLFTIPWKPCWRRSSGECSLWPNIHTAGGVQRRARPK